MPFKHVTLIGLGVAVVLVALQSFIGPGRDDPTRVRRIGWWERVAYAMTLVGVLVLALTGLGSILTDHRLDEWGLIIHVGIGPLFALGLTAIALAWADRCRFGASAPPSRFDGWHKVLFWGLLVCGLGVMVTALLPMTPLFGQHGQELLLNLHRYFSLATAVIVIAHAGRFLQTR